MHELKLLARIRRIRKHLKLVPLAIIATIIPTSPAWSYDDTGGRFEYIVSPQICKARYESQERYVIRSANAQIRNNRNTTLQLVCPLQKTYDADNNGACNTSFSLWAHIRLRPTFSTASARVRLIFADANQGVVPGAFKEESTFAFADATWDGSSIYTDTRLVSVSMSCIQQDSTNTDIDLDDSTNKWVPSAIIFLPSGAMLRRLTFRGGENGL